MILTSTWALDRVKSCRSLRHSKHCSGNPRLRSCKVSTEHCILEGRSHLLQNPQKDPKIIAKQSQAHEGAAAAAAATAAARSHSSLPETSTESRPDRIKKGTRREFLNSSFGLLGGTMMGSLPSKEASAFPSPSLEMLQESAATSSARCGGEAGISALRNPAIYRHVRCFSLITEAIRFSDLYMQEEV